MTSRYQMGGGGGVGRKGSVGGPWGQQVFRVSDSRFHWPALSVRRCLMKQRSRRPLIRWVSVSWTRHAPMCVCECVWGRERLGAGDLNLWDVVRVIKQRDAPRAKVPKIQNDFYGTCLSPLKSKSSCHRDMHQNRCLGVFFKMKKIMKTKDMHKTAGSQSL